MQDLKNSTEWSSRLDVLGEQPLLKIYTQICLCFSVPEPSLQSEIVKTLKFGLERLSSSFPWVAGHVVLDNEDTASFGTPKIRPCGKTPCLVVKDLRSDLSIPTMAALKRARFPFSMLDENIICPVTTLPGTSMEAGSDSAPVFLLQANFITGGLLLSLVGEHRTMDMTGQGQIIHLLSKACRNEQFTAEELRSGNIDRRSILTLLDDSYAAGPELRHQVLQTSGVQAISEDTNANKHSILPSCVWSYFSFSATSLAKLKSLALQNLAPTTDYVSTDDTLTAFIWQSIMRSRLHRLNPNMVCKFARAVDVRPYLDISSTYPGLMQNMTYHSYTLENLIKEPLGTVASQFRVAVDPRTSDLGYNTRALATFFDRATNKSIVSFTASLDLSVDIMLSSWAKLDCHELDFNFGLGKPEAVRRPHFTPVESLLYFMPKARNGEIAVALCLRDEDLKHLRADEEFISYGSFIEG